VCGDYGPRCYRFLARIQQALRGQLPPPGRLAYCYLRGPFEYESSFPPVPEM